MEEKLNKVQNIASNVLLFIAFILPINKIITSWAIILALLLAIYLWVTQRKNPFSPFNGLQVVLLALYGLTFTGLMYTKSFDNQIFEVEQKFTFLAFPILFSIVPADRKKLIDYFLYGLTVGALICLGVAGYNFFQEGDYKVFYYSKLSILHHASYYAMYMVFGLIILLCRTVQKELKMSGLISPGLISIYVVLLGSKMGIFTMVFCWITYLLYQAIYLHNLKLGIISFAIICLGIFGVSKVDFIQKRFTPLVELLQGANSSREDSNTMRLMTWKSSIDLFLQSPIIGVSAGDSRALLKEEYVKRGGEIAAKRSLNSHNQFLEYLLAYGVVGVILFVLHFMLAFRDSFRRKDNLLFLFTTLFMVNCLTESMLQAQSGVVFYLFFLSYFVFGGRNAYTSDSETPVN